jgi:hypothetical protein
MGKSEHVTPDKELAAFLATIADLERRGQHEAAAHFRKAHQLIIRYFVERDAGRIEAAEPWIKAATREFEAAKALLAGKW